VNSATHCWGTVAYDSGDASRNNKWVAALTFGEGWHNNHHRYAVCTRQGFRWWEIDMSYFILRVLQLFRIVWEIREPPRSLLEKSEAA